ncbi:MAG: hypothetical protein QM208_02470, partial [Bacillota bacterium]|nr:hypothetical protein [Bacillota bacterium]
SAGDWKNHPLEALNQLKYGVKLKNVKGHCIYSFKHLRYAYEESVDPDYAANFRNVKEEAWKYKAIMPEIRTYDPIALPAAENLAVADDGEKNILSFNNNPEVKFYIIYRSGEPITYAPEEIYDIIGADPDDATVTYADSDNGAYYYAVRPLSITNALGEGAAVKKGIPIRITVSYLYDDDNEITIEDIKPYGDSYVHDFTEREGYSFAYWVVNGVVSDDLPADYEFIVSSAMNIQAVFRAPGKHTVLFIDSNGALLAARYVASGGSAEPPAALPDKPGMKIAAVPWKTRDNKTDLDNITGDRVFILQYEIDNDETFTLTVDGETFGEYRYNQVATVTTPAEKNGLPFSRWEEDGRRASYRTEFSFTMLSDRHLTAIYGDGESVLPLVSMEEMLKLRADYYSFLGRIEYPEGYERVEAGFLLASELTVPVLDADGVETVPAPKFNDATNEFLMSFPVGLFERVRAVRAYLVVRDDEGEIAVYYSDYCHLEEFSPRDAERDKLLAYLAEVPAQILGDYQLNNEDFLWEYKDGEDETLFDIETGEMLERKMTQALRTFIVSSRKYPDIKAERVINFGLTPTGVTASINGNDTTPADPKAYNISTYYQLPFTGYTLSFERGGTKYRHFVVYSLEITSPEINLKPAKAAGSIGILYVNKTGADLAINLSETHVTNNSAYASPIIDADGEVIAVIGVFDSGRTITVPKDGALWAPAYLDGPVAGNVNSCNINVKSQWQAGDIILIEKWD